MLSRYASDNNKPIDNKEEIGSKWPSIKHSLYKTDADLEKLAEQLLIWARLDDSIKVTDFLCEKRITPQEFKEWQEKSPYLKRANNLAKLEVGSRREKRGLEGKYNSAIVLNTMPLYDEEYAAWRKEQNASKNEGSSNQTIVVVRDRYPETEVVKSLCEGTE